MAKENIKDQLDLLREKGHTVYSISRLNSYNDCQYGYYRSYVLKDRGDNNIYASLGGKIHDHLQNICDGVETVDGMVAKFEEDFETDTMFMNFPSEKIMNSWKADMTHFVNNFEPLQYDKIVTEKGFVINVGGVWMQGFIDVLAFEGDNIVILDWKTSSSFSKDKLKHAGRQLVLYKLAIEEILNKKVNKAGWFMLKYINVHFDGKVKQCNRGSWVKDRGGVIKTQLKKLGYDNYEEMLEVAIENNTLDNMPQEVQDRFVVEPCIVWYDITDDILQETKEYIVNTANEIESKDIENTRLWQCKNVYKDKFFCQNLCGHSDNCIEFKHCIKNSK